MRKNSLPAGGGKVLVALSGGVDSSVAAAILANTGFEVIGIHFLMWKDSSKKNGNFEERKNILEVQKIAKVLGIKLEIVDIKDKFKKWVIDEWLESYKRGETPNPCIICNKKIKFNLLLQIADKLGCDFISTGHYARIEKIKYRNRIEYALLRAKDERKDQSYFLYRLNQQILSRALFPNGENTKEKTRELAKKFYLPTAKKIESQEICFIPDDIKSFLKRHLKDYLIPGKVVNKNGEVIGEHYGLPLYTVGQRHGFKINFELRTKNLEQRPKDKNLKPLYVISKGIKNNLLVVGTKEEAKRKSFEVEKVNWVREVPQSGYKNQFLIRIRSSGDFYNGSVIYYKKGNYADTLLTSPQMGISPGQSAVFYRENEVVGGGIIGA